VAEIVYRFIASGQDTVEKAFIGIEAAAKRNEKAVERTYDVQARAARRSATVQETSARRPASRTEQLAKQVERDQARSEQRQIREKQRSLDYVSRIRDRHFQTEQKREKQHYDKLFAASDAHQKRITTQAAQAATAQVRTETQFRERIQRERSASLGRIGGELKGAVIGGAAATGAIGLGIAGTATKDAFGLQAIANRISINGRKSSDGFIDPSIIRREMESASLSTNGIVKAEDVGAGMQKFVSKIGDVKKAREFAPIFAQAAAAGDVSAESVSSMGAELFQKFKIESAEDMKQAIASVYFGGKEGAFEMTDAADKYAKMGSAASTFGLDKGVGGVRKLQGLSQIAMAGVGDKDVAASNMSAMFRELIKNGAKIEAKTGYSIFTDDSRTKAKDITEVLPEVIARFGGDKVDLEKAFGAEGGMAIAPLVDTFTQAYGSATGKNGKKATADERTAAGKAAIQAQLATAINAPGSFADLQLDAKRASENNPSAKVAESWDKMVSAMGDKMIPMLDRLIGSIEASPGAIDAFVGTFQILVDAMVSAAKAFRIIKDPNDDPEEKKNKELKKAKDAGTQLAALPSLDKAKALVAAGKFDDAKAMLGQLEDPATKKRIFDLKVEQATALSQANKIESVTRRGDAVKTKGQFEDLYSELATKTPGTDQETYRPLAKMVAANISANPTGTSSGEGLLPGENEQQRQVRLQYAQNTSFAKTQAGGSTTSEGADVAATGIAKIMAEVAKNALAASAALNKVGAAGQPSISHG
jgi:hypothetical protein